MTKVAILEDHYLVVHSLQDILKLQTEIELVHVSNLADDFIKFIPRGMPDIVLVDLQLPDRSGLEVVEFILTKFPEIKIIILTCVDDLSIVQRLIEKGCKGYLCKGETNMSEILDGLTAVMEGEVYLSEQMHERLKKDNYNKFHNLVYGEHRFTKREMQVLTLINEGLTSKEIADQLEISRRTVDTHRQNLMNKLDVNNVTSLCNKARDLSLL